MNKSDDRGVSVALNYTATLVIVAMLISGLFIGMGTFLRDERQKTVTSEFEVLGNRIAADLAAADRLAQTTSGSNPRVEVTTRVPDQVAGTSYSITITANGVDPDSDGSDEYHDVNISLSANSLGVNETVQVRTEHDVAFGEEGGGDYRITYTGGALEVSND